MGADLQLPLLSVMSPASHAASGSPFKVLIGCEHTGAVRDAFIALGHEAMSCDLLPTESPGPHYQGDVFDVIDYPWDIAIFHPACTHIAVSGAHRFADKRMDGRQQSAVAFFMRLQRRSEHIPKTATENPVCIMSSIWRKPDQIIQPFEFGHPESKKTCLWLKGLPLLRATNLLALPECGHWENQTASGQNKLPPSDDRWKLRSATYKGIAEAMALQWGVAVCQCPKKCDCQDESAGLVSNECPIHNLYPRPAPDCPIHAANGAG